MPKHIHAELIKQWADGAEIQRLSPFKVDHPWIDDDEPCWESFTRYRIKPIPKTIEYKRFLASIPTYTSKTCFRVLTYNGGEGPSPEYSSYFIKWIDTEWQEVEVPE